MDAMMLRLYESQVAFQIRSGLRSHVAFEAALSSGDMDEAWMAIEGLLNAVANVSKVCWGMSGKRAVERQPVRESLGVDDSSPLKATTMRNHFEHFDQRINVWWETSAEHNMIDFNFGESISASEVDIFRNYDLATGQLVFWGDTFDIPAIAQALKSLRPRAEEQAQKPHWVP